MVDRNDGPSDLHLASYFFMEMDHLEQPFSSPEIETALWSMNSYKSPGSDGIQAHFFKYGWNVIHRSLVHFANSMLSIILNKTKTLIRLFFVSFLRKSVLNKWRIFVP